MGDRIGVRTDHAPDVASAPDVPDVIESQASTLATTWRSITARKRMQASADVVPDIGSDPGEAEQLPSETASSFSSGTAPSVSTSGISKWDALRHSEAWKDRQFLLSLAQDTSGTTTPDEAPTV
jgi:hypothetical protein